ncbi:MAG: hypothetical protein H7Z38_20715, partial [Rubrivivax sp.]|nr:hypothetical protein [Pyrinomonadaceae bacterium]
MPSHIVLIFLFLSAALCAPGIASARTNKSAIRNPQSAIVRLAVLDLGEARTSGRVADRLTKLLSGASASGETRLALLDRALSRAAARGAGYAGSLNMTLS